MADSSAHDLTLREHSFAELSADQFHRILRLRIDAFVVEQACVYPELDGRDVEPGTRHFWLELPTSDIVCYLRVLNDGECRRIGRVVTTPSGRGRGLAAHLVDTAVAHTAGPWVLDAQSHLEHWYATRGFVRTGVDFVEDGIPHVPMRRVIG